VERVALGVCAVTLFVVMLVGAADIVSGEVFGTFLSFKVDMSGTLAAAAIFLAWPLVQRRRDHIRVDLFLPFMPRALRLLGWWLSQVIGLGVFGLIAYGAVDMAIDSVGIWEASAATLGYPIWPAKLACAVGAAITISVFLLQAWRGPGRDE
jgi:TRAP-type C4-dicarboxylate transport system permease small subunit